MKYCEEYAALLDLFVDGELPPEEMEKVRDHLTVCPGCRAYVDDALAIRAGFPDAEETAVPEGFAAGVMKRIREDSAKDGKIVELKRRGVRRWLGTAAALAACCALVILVRTGPGNDAAAPAGENGAAYDTAAMIGGEAAGIAPQAAPESKEELTEEAVEEEIRTTAAARSKTLELYKDDQAPKAAPSAGADTAAPTEAAPEEKADEEQFCACPPALEAALYLTQEEAGDLLNGFTVVWENAVEWGYELNAEEYRALLEALGRQVELPETGEGPFLVVVTGPLE